MRSMVLKVTKYLNFSELKDTGKTKVIGVGNNAGVKLGLIQWKATWRRYCFVPLNGTMYDAICLSEIIEFINELMDGRK